MRLSTLLAASFALIACAGAADAATITFDYEEPTPSNGFGRQSYSIGEAGIYRIEAYGARGGSGSAGRFSGGNGAYVGGNFSLSLGSVLNILIGGQGQSQSGLAAGGGGLSIVTLLGTPLVIAGGGGGAGQGASGRDAGIGSIGTPGTGMVSAPGPGSSNGSGGGAIFGGGGGGGGGLNGSGMSAVGASGGSAYNLGAEGGYGSGGRGGFSGGGGANITAGGGGAGYSGGGGGGVFGGGGGGGSFVSDLAIENSVAGIPGLNLGNGFVTLSYVSGLPSPVPLPSSAPLFGAALLGLAGLGYVSKRKNAAAAAA